MAGLHDRSAGRRDRGLSDAGAEVRRGGDVRDIYLKRIVILGSTGSIGTQTLDVAARHAEELAVVGLAAAKNATLLATQAQALGLPSDRAVCGDPAATTALAARPDVDLVVVAVAGAAGIDATLAALDAGHDVALATKEVLVAAGRIVMEAARRSGARILPIDSEHSAIFQCLQGTDKDEIATIWLTASGGPFREWPADRIASASPSDALKHPTWPSMGRKITVDSATLMNKGLETIEAMWLFDLPVDRVGVLVHPQSLVHGMAQMRDGSLLAQISSPDMRLPIQYALLHPRRPESNYARLDPVTLSALSFEPPDLARFPCLALARQAAAAGGTTPAAMNAANEEAVAAFLAEKIPFGRIPRIVESAMWAHTNTAEPDLDSIRVADGNARTHVARMLESLATGS